MEEKQLVTAQEAVELVEYRTILDFEICEQISAAHFKKTAAQPKNGSTWNYMTLLATIWNAGRVQGIREERRKKHAA